VAVTTKIKKIFGNNIHILDILQMKTGFCRRKPHSPSFFSLFFSSSLPHWLASSLTHWLASSLPHWLASSLPHTLAHWLTLTQGEERNMPDVSDQDAKEEGASCVDHAETDHDVANVGNAQRTAHIRLQHN
jgi:hypothetical protein